MIKVHFAMRRRVMRRANAPKRSRRAQEAWAVLCRTHEDREVMLVEMVTWGV